MIVTNGTGITSRFLDHAGPYIDWIALSIDSASSDVEALLGRGAGNHAERCLQTASLIRKHGKRLKVNTTVTALTCDEDMHDLLRQLAPERWKVFRFLPIQGENDAYRDQLAVTSEQFHAFLERHRDLQPVGEDNSDMIGSYVMLDPAGRFFQNFGGVYTHSESILERGVSEALKQVGWDPDKFRHRGGDYDWGPAHRVA